MPGRLDFSSLRGAVASLGEGVSTVNDRSWYDVQTAAVRNLVLAGVIQNFEFAFELAFKMLRRQLENDADSPAEVDAASYRDVLRTAAERGLVDDVEAWIGFRQMRNMTSHTYDHARATQVWQGIPAFLEAAQALLGRLEARNA